jgi:hypothetical protein
MAITNHETGEKSFIGCVIRTYDHYWMDGMLEEYAVVWNPEKEKIEYITVGYYGNDCRNMMATTADADLTVENAREILRCYVKKDALRCFQNSVQESKQKIYKDDLCKVVRGRKVKKGTILKVFWVGEKPTYRAQMYAYLNETETIAGCYDENGEKVWIKAEYLEKMPECRLKSPCAAERKKYVKWFIEKNYDYILRVAETR